MSGSWRGSEVRHVTGHTERERNQPQHLNLGQATSQLSAAQTAGNGCGEFHCKNYCKANYMVIMQ